jgi:hypothetical protein
MERHKWSGNFIRTDDIMKDDDGFGMTDDEEEVIFLALLIRTVE